jgi:delta14-sterol reductase
MRITIDTDLCQGHAVCMGEAPDVFQVGDDGKLTLLTEQPPERLRDQVHAAAKYCPTRAITIRDCTMYAETILPITIESLLEASKLFLLYFLLPMFLGAALLPGIERKGYPLPDGSKLSYRLTGMTLFFWTHIIVGVAVFGFGFSLAPLIAHFWSLFIVVNAVALIWTVALYLQGRVNRSLRLDAGQGVRLPALIKDLFFGNQQNPTLLGVDLKMFMYQPSLIGVGLLIAAFGFVQYERTGLLTPQMVCLMAFWWLYLWTHYVKEEFMLSTWDVQSENFGFMLVWGDLVYVPFFYSIPGWWVAADQHAFPPWAVALLCAFYLLCLIIFRQANWQKERYKQDGQAKIWGKAPKTIGGRLLISGWWGIGRKINYSGEIGVYFAFAFCGGFHAWQPYLLPISLVFLLTQRAARDDKKCREKYGETWQAYCGRVKFRIFPFVY